MLREAFWLGRPSTPNSCPQHSVARRNGTAPSTTKFPRAPSLPAQVAVVTTGGASPPCTARINPLTHVAPFFVSCSTLFLGLSLFFSFFLSCVANHRRGFKSRALIPVALPRASSSSRDALCNKWVRRAPVSRACSPLFSGAVHR